MCNCLHRRNSDFQNVSSLVELERHSYIPTEEPEILVYAEETIKGSYVVPHKNKRSCRSQIPPWGDAKIEARKSKRKTFLDFRLYREGGISLQTFAKGYDPRS